MRVTAVTVSAAIAIQASSHRLSATLTSAMAARSFQNSAMTAGDERAPKKRTILRRAALEPISRLSR
jgi:hypothetical protein